MKLSTGKTILNKIFVTWGVGVYSSIILVVMETWM
jgi:hypothetical protein